MRSYLALLKMDLRLAVRNRLVVFFNYLLPLVFLFAYGGMFHADRGGMGAYVVTLVLQIGILTNGLFGAGVRAVQEREQNILRRFKVAPISPAPILVASLISGWLLYLPGVVLVLGLAHAVYGMPLPTHLFSLLLVVSVGLVAFRALGMMVAAVANSTQESQILTQFLFLPMMFLGGAALPLSLMPAWVRVASQFMPTTHLGTSMQAILLRDESALASAGPLLALLVTLGLGLFIAVKLFRWEKDEKLPATSKLWVGLVLLPFVAFGAYAIRDQDRLHKGDALFREISRRETLLIRGPRIFVGDGRVIEQGSVLVKNGRIEEIFETAQAPDAGALKAALVEASGKTLLPGLIDVHAHLGGYATIPAPDRVADYPAQVRRTLAQYLYSGVTAVRSVGDSKSTSLDLKRQIASGERLGAELFACGPMFTTEGGHGTEYFKDLPEPTRSQTLQETVRLPKTPEEARAQVRELKKAGVDCIKAILESGQAGRIFNRMDVSLLRAVAEEARAQKLPLSIHTGDSHDIADALDAGADGIEHGSARDPIPDALLARLAERRVAYDPTLAVMDTFSRIGSGKGVDELLSASLVQQVIPSEWLASTRTALAETQASRFAVDTAQAKQNLLRAWQAGVPLAVGTDAGNLLVFHGPSLHRELKLWVEAGLPPAVALQAATSGAAHALRADDRIGLVKKGYEANLLLVDGNPLQDISATERISLVVFKGERLDRTELFREQ